MTSPYGQHHDSAHSFTAPDPHLPLRRASSQRLHARRQGGPKPLFAAQQNHVKGFHPSPVEPVPQVVNVTASSEHAFAAKDERTKRPFKPPLGVQVLQKSPTKSRSQVNPYRAEYTRDARRLPPSPLRPDEMNNVQERAGYKLRSSKSVGESMRWPARRSSKPGVMPSPTLSSRCSSDSVPQNTMYEEVRVSMRSAVTGTSSRVNSSVNTDLSSRLTDDSSISDADDSKWPGDLDKRASFDVEDAIGLYEDGFESARESFENERPKRSLDARPLSSSLHPTRPHYMHRRSQSASILERVNHTSAGIRTSRVVSVQPPALPVKDPSTPTPVARDRYGFKKASHHITVEQYDAWDRSYQDHLNRRRKKWYGLMKSYGLSTDDPIRFPPKSDKIKRYVRKGIPPEWRGAAWFWYAGGPGILKAQPDLYQRLLREADNGKLSDNDREHIERDLNRTFPDNITFKPDPTSTLDAQNGAGGGENEVSIVKALRRVLQAFAVHNPSIGYCQSLNFIAGLLLLFLKEDEEKSFVLLNLVTSLHLPGTHGVTLEGANIDIAVLMSCIKDSLPNVWAKLDDKGEAPSMPPVAQALRLPTVSLATTAWFMSLFVGTLPMEGVLRTWDCLFFEGSKTLFRIALAIFKAGERQIVAVDDPMEIFQVVQTIPRSMLDVNALMDVCFRRRGGFGYLSQDVIERRRDERRKEVKAGIAGGEQGLKKWRSRWRSKTMKT